MNNALSVTLEGEFGGYLRTLMEAGTVTEREAKRMQGQLNSLNRFIAEQEKAQRAATQAMTDQAKATAAVDKIATAAKAAGVSVGQMNAALRNTPAQLTDIVTQLAGGQSPFLIMIQQGGQMRDMFGGFGGMFRGLATMISPVTVGVGALAAVAGAVGYAFTQASKEQESFNKAMALTGGYAGQTGATMDALAAKVAHSTNITIGAARDIGTALVQSGRVGSGQLEPMAAAIAKLSTLSGETADKLVGDFAKMRDGVAKWAEEHNKQYHFLTLAEYKQIEAAEKAGDTNRAVDITLGALNANLRTSKSTWDELTQAVGDYWEKLKKAAGPSTMEQRLQELEQKRSAYLQSRGIDDRHQSEPGNMSTPYDGQIQSIRNLIKTQNDLAAFNAQYDADQEKKIEAEAKRAKEAEAASKRDKEAIDARIRSYEQEAVRLARETDNLKRYGKATNDARVEVEQLALAEGEYAKADKGRKGKLLQVASTADALARAKAQEEALIAKVKEAQAKEEAFTKSKAQHTLAIDKEIASMQAEVSLVGRSTEEREIAAKAIAIHAQAESMMAQYAEKSGEILAWEAEQVNKVTAAIKAKNAVNRDPQTGVDRAITKYQEEAQNQAKYTENLVTGGLSKMEDAIVSFVHTGKLSFESLWTYMADEFIKQQLRMVMSAQMSSGSGLGSLLGSMLGGKSSTAGSGSSGASPAPFSEAPIPAATGYDYVPRDNTPFLLHEGERVLTAAENRAYSGGGQPIVQNVSIGQGVSRAEVAAALAQSNQALLNTILSSRQHRGAFA